MFHEQALFSVSHHWSLEGSIVQLFSWLLIVEKYLNGVDLKKKVFKKFFKKVPSQDFGTSFGDSLKSSTWKQTVDTHV